MSDKLAATFHGPTPTTCDHCGVEIDANSGRDATGSDTCHSDAAPYGWHEGTT